MTRRKSRPQPKRNGSEITRTVAKRSNTSSIMPDSQTRRALKPPLSIDQERIAPLGVDSCLLSRVDRPRDFIVRLVIVVPTATPFIAFRIDQFFAQYILRMAISQHDIGATIVPIRGPFHGVLRIHVGVETAIRLAVREHQ